MVLFIKKNFSLFTSIGHIPWSFMLVKFSSFSASMNPSWLASIILNRNSDSRSVISRLVIFSTACLNSPFKVKCKNGVNLTNWAPSRSFYWRHDIPGRRHRWRSFWGEWSFERCWCHLSTGDTCKSQIKTNLSSVKSKPTLRQSQGRWWSWPQSCWSRQCGKPTATPVFF